MTVRLDDIRWQVVKNKTTGNFIYAVKTTGIFCRPGCASRLPRPENVEFFDDSAAARAAGYRPCKRCRPEALSAHNLTEQRILTACRLIESADKAPTLEALATQVGLSPYHFQRLFKKHLGLSPKQYARACQSNRFRSELSDQGRVTDALYAAGLSSASAIYGDGDRTGMMPKSYAQGGAGEVIRYSLANSEIGWVLVAATARGICAIDLGDDEATLIRDLHGRFPQAQQMDSDPQLQRWLTSLLQSIGQPDSALDLPLEIRGTAFQQRVWRALQAIPAGETLSYNEIAQRIGHPRATRAVAAACANNRWALAVPCHRAVRKDGQATAFRWGAPRKLKLLAREARPKKD